ncbi:hypothetical protein CARUB_v10020808mg [Capsella rubella]|uniref:LRAT domain-containing protein n=1 Tax=Capsella rubella TaxID=81985 RepID=R0GIQ3_9BRAS|nr:uncharacterized protein LOC17896193 [Capsella rubella]EOA35596.1 hypothetical protein CARUB_v10020808mg [Capsella rubella]
MGILSNKISRDMLNLGDHIYSWRKAFAYAHHGIHVGNGRVIHFTCGRGQETGTFLGIIASSSPNHGVNPCPTCGYSSQLSGVLSSCLECFLAGGSLYRFEYSASSITFLAKPRGGACTTLPSDLPDEVVRRANYLLQNGFADYHVITNNCESFAIYCKTSLVFQDQAATSSQALSGAWAFQTGASMIFSTAGVAFVTTGAQIAGAASVAAIAGPAIVLPCCFAAGTNILRLMGDKGLKHQRKVPVERVVSQINAGRARRQRGA